MMSAGVSLEMGIPDRGAKPDTQTAIGSLGWIRKTTMWATLEEVCFLTNAEDVAVLHGELGYEKAAMGIVSGISRAFGVKSPAYDEIEASKPVELIVYDAEITVKEGGSEKVYKCIIK